MDELVCGVSSYTKHKPDFLNGIRFSYNGIDGAAFLHGYDSRLSREQSTAPRLTTEV